jgi:DNA invertase Pin-like site-specific DNA recombinase
VNAAAYVRVSSRSQSLATQRAAIERTVRARGDRVVQWFAEKQSAARLERGELSNLREAVRAGGVRRLYVFKLDRLSRGGIRDTLQVLQELRAGGCQVVTIADGFDLDGPAAEPLIAMMAWAAQMELAAIGDRRAAARLRVEAQGGAWGRPRRVTEAKVREIRSRAQAGETQRAIAVAMKVPKATVGRILGQKGAYAADRKARKKHERAGLVQ